MVLQYLRTIHFSEIEFKALLLSEWRCVFLNDQGILKHH